MSDIERFVTIWGGGGMMPANNGNYVRYDDHRAEVERVIADVVKLRIDLNSVQVEASQLRGEAERLKAQVAALTVAVEQADEMKAHAEAAAAWEKAQTDRVVADGNKALAEVERLTGALRETRETLARVQVQYDEFAKVTAKVIDQHQRERDDARQQVYRLQQAGADRPTDQSAQNLDMANGQGMFDSSRPSDEDIWRQAFTVALQSPHFNRTKMADEVLAEYRKRWPR